MVKPILLLALLFNLVFSLNQAIAQSQSFEFEWVAASPYAEEGIPYSGTEAFAVNAAGDQFTALTAESFIHNGTINFGSVDLTQYDSESNIIWTIILNDTLFINQVAATTNGGCILFGSFVGNLSLGNFTVLSEGQWNRSVLVHISETGSIENIIPATSLLGDYRPAAISLKGGLVYAMLNGSGFADHSYIEIYNIETFDHVETIVQNAVFMGDLDVDDQGNIYLTGSCINQDGSSSFNETVVDGAGQYNKFLMKYNSSHQFDWIRTYDDITCPQPSVRVSPDGNSIYFSDELYDAVIMGDFALEGPNWVYDFYIARFNPEGELQWAKEIPNFVLGDANPGKGEFLVAENEGVALTGFFRNFLTWNEDTLLINSEPQSSLFVLKLDGLGDALWSKGIETQSGVTSGLSLSRAGDSYYVNGHFWGSCSFSEDYSFSGEFYQKFTAKLSEISTDIAVAGYNSELLLYPNPTTAFLKINPISSFSGLSFSIYSVSGKCLHEGVFGTSIQTIDLRSFAAGVYILRVAGDEPLNARFVKL